MKRGRYGTWGKHLELFEQFDDFRRDPAVHTAMIEEGLLQEGTGAPEGRVDFPYFLQTVIRHKIRERFKSAAGKWDSYVGIESAQDFREHTVSELGPIRGITGVAEHGQYEKLRSREAPGPSYAVGKYGGIYSVTYELIINDDTNRILSRIPTELGRAMAEYVNQTVVAFIESNPTYIDGTAFFHSSRANLRSGADAAPTSDSLVAALDILKLRRDADNIPMIFEPRRILVKSPSIKLRLDTIIRSQQTGVSSEVTAVGAPGFHPGTMNPLYNVLPADAVVEDPWLNDPNDWYILSNADERPAFVAAFLRGQRTPQIFLKDSGMRGVGGGGQDPYEMEVDEIPYKLRHVFGVASGEPLAAMKMSQT